MCGITGIFDLQGRRPVSRTVLEAMTDAMRHRGPDDAGVAVFGKAGIAMRRLSIVGLATGHQPISNEDGTVWVVFNGEIYNHAALRAELERRGHHFRTASDTEALVHAYEEYGDGFVERLNGMFAFAIWDDRRARLLLARDRVGIKPLFYFNDGRRLVFSSEIKSLLQSPDVPREVDPEGLDAFLTLESVPAPRTLLRGVFKLRQGHILIADGAGVEERRYWSPLVEPKAWDERAAADALRAELSASVRRRLMSEVPLGAFLSGGIDSSIIVGLMAEAQSRPVQTFSISFRDRSYDESRYARLVAERFGTDHHEERLDIDPVNFLDDFRGYLDEPNADTSLFPTFLVSKAARRNVTVCLSGDGGDELFGGYDTYLADRVAGGYEAIAPRFLKRAVASFFDGLRPSEKKKGGVNRAKRFAEAFSFPKELEHYRWMMFLPESERLRLYTHALRRQITGNPAYDAIGGTFSRARLDWDRLTRQSFVDLSVYLADDILWKVDLTSMANSLEVRVPFLDHNVVELALSMPGRLKIKGADRKWILKKAFADFLPGEILRRGKEGFSVPLKNWLKSELRPTMESVLNEDAVESMGFFEWTEIRALMDDHLSGRRNNAHLLWSLIVFHLWHDKFIRAPRAAHREAVVA